MQPHVSDLGVALPNFGPAVRHKPCQRIGRAHENLLSRLCVVRTRLLLSLRRRRPPRTWRPWAKTLGSGRPTGSVGSWIEPPRLSFGRRVGAHARSWPAGGSPHGPVRAVLQGARSDERHRGHAARQPLPDGAVAVFAPRPAAGPALAVLELLLGPADATFSGPLLLGILDPADELVARQGRDVLPGIECRGVGDQRLAQVGG